MSGNAAVQPTVAAPLSPTESRDRRNRIIMSALAALLGGASVVTNLGGAFAGEIPSMCRVALGLVGVAAAVVLWLRPALGWRLGWLWALAQIPVFAWSVDGSPTAQWLHLPLAMTSQTTVNGEVTAYSSLGINLVGIILFIVFQRMRESAERLNG